MFHLFCRSCRVLLILLCGIFSLPCAAFEEPPTITMGTVTLNTGVTLQYAEQGRGERNLVIMLHGWLDSWFSFSTVMANMSSNYHVIALTQRGHGDSSKPHNAYEMTDYSDDVVAFMDHFGYRKASIVGHSLGAVIAQQLAIDHPERINKLILIGPGADITQNAVLNEVAGLIVDAQDPLDRAFVYEFQSGTAPHPYTSAFIETIIDESMKVPAEIWRQTLAGLLRANTSNDLHKILAPTLILWAAEDPIFSREEQDQLRAEIPNITFIEYPNLNHSIQWQQPRLVALEISAFLRSHVNTYPDQLVPKQAH